MPEHNRAMPDVQSPAKVVAGALGLTGFTVAIISGMAAGNDSSTVITAAIISMLACHVLGLCIGLAADRVLRTHVEEYRASRPISGSPSVVHNTGANSSTSGSELSTDAKKK
jgi:tetrahydromethanopterin S-methyltransferase subunit C